MKITNLGNFPAALVRAIENDPYTKGDSDFSVTELLQPPRIRRLKKLHADEITEDVADRLWSLYGQLAHTLIERANENDLAEKRFAAMIGDFKVSCAIDSYRYLDKTLTDWKFVTAWAFKGNQAPKPEYVAQMNMQAEILRLNGIEPEKLQIVGLLRDWQIRDAKANPDYPQSPVVTQPIEMWSREAVQSFMQLRIALHVAAENELPECSPEERWAKPDVYAVVKGKRAINGGVQYSLETAEKLCAENPGTRVEFRKGESTRCSMYCPVAEFCTQYKQELEKKDAI